MKKEKNYKLVLGFLIGILISITGVYATTTYFGTATDLIYDNEDSWLSSSDVQSALDKLYETKSNPCPEGVFCEKSKLTPELGDYVLYTPSVTSFTTDTEKTGYRSKQTINPSEINLWRVLNVNDDGTVEIISEYVSNAKITFRGLTGYRRFVQALNILASKYETEGITVGSRHFGYAGQTEYISDASYLTSTSSPWACATGYTGSCSPHPKDYEEYGGGDRGFETDYNRIVEVLGSANAGNSGTYWTCSRNYQRSTSVEFKMDLWPVISGKIQGIYNVASRSGSSAYSTNVSASIRPIVTLSSELLYEGFGTYDYPMKILS